MLGLPKKIILNILGSMKKYHAHIYFAPHEASTIQDVHGKARRESRLMQVFGIISVPVGPHSTGMFEAHFTDDNKNEVIQWLKVHRQGLSVLIHEDTGDDYRDHTENVLWLGEKLPLDFGFFDLVKRDPSKALHK
jgi:aromatic ring-cleaving dioxygenase